MASAAPTTKRCPVTTPQDFFLPEINIADDVTFRAGARSGCTVTPLIDGVAAFQAMEQAIAGAQTTIHLSLWIFNPSTPLQARAAVNSILAKRGHKGAVGTWGELLSAVAGMGVKVRVIINDFDPILSNANHASNWQAYFALRTAAVSWSKSNLEVMVSMHDARTSLAAAVLLPGRLTNLLTAINRGGITTALSRVAAMPRLWPYVQLNPRRTAIVQAASVTWTIFPASHHQKLCVVDRKVGFCGGLDVNKGRIATPVHDGRLWHDADLRVDAQVAADLDRNFLARWNREAPVFNAFIPIRDPTGRPLAARPVTAPVALPTAAVTSGNGPALAQMWRTLSRDNPASPVPTALVTDIRDGHQHAISLAQQFIYIENQYIRDPRLADWLITRRGQVSGLVVIMVLPVAPEEVSAVGGADDVTLLGLSLQHDVLTRLISVFGSDFGVFSLAAKAAATVTHATNTNGSLQVYVHNKTIIVDDAWCCVGSANLNPRSFEVDTEANVAWHEPAGVRAYRLSLWRELLGAPAGIAKWAPGDFLANWNAIAAANAKLTTSKTIPGRRGFVVPHDPARFPGSGSALIPNAFAELVDTDPEPEFTV